jgi:hypothetical protein
MVKAALFPIFSLFAIFSLSAQGDARTPLPSFMEEGVFPYQDQVIVDSLARWEERVYLHTDRDQALPGDVLFFKAYVFNSPTRRRFSPSGVLRVELRDRENALVAAQYHPIREGTGEGVLRLPGKLPEGSYELLAYTRWMKNYGEGQFFRMPIRIGEARENLDLPESPLSEGVSFHPEGGRLLAGVPNRLILQSTNNLQGAIVDETGNAVVKVQGYADGYGLAIFRPLEGKSYQFKAASGELFPLPGVEPHGYALKMNNLSPEKLLIEVEATEGMGGQPLLLEGEQDGRMPFVHVLEFKDGPTQALEIPTAGLARGLMTFRLRDYDGTEWAERSVWMDPRKELDIEVTPMGPAEGSAKQAAFKIRVTAPDGSPVQTDLSVGVRKGAVSGEGGLDAFLQPEWLSMRNTGDRKERFLSDLKALSKTEEAPVREFPGEIKYPVQRSLELHGTAYDLDNNLLAKTRVQVLATSDSTLVIREVTTDAAGVLHLEGLEVVGETQLIFRTRGEDQKERLVKVVPILEKAPGKGTAIPEPQKSTTYARTQRKMQVVESTQPVPYDTTGVIKLREATVEDKRRLQHELVPSLYGIQPNPRDIVYQDLEKPLPIDMLLLKIPGFQVRPTVEGIPVAYHLRRGGGGVLWVVDGQVIRTNQDPEYSPLVYLTPLDILRIEFIIDAGQTSIFGVQAPTGVVLIYTRSGNFLDYVDRKEGGLNFKGYEPVLDFESYLAERSRNRKLRKTALPTVYWNPGVQTDENGEAIIRFNIPEGSENLQFTVETLSPQGLPGSFRKDLREMR